MTDDIGAGFTAIFTFIIVIMTFGIPMVPLIFGGIDWIAHYDRYEQYKMYRQQATDELRSATDETGWYTEQFDIYSHYADPRKNYTFKEYKADAIEFHVTFNVTPEIDDPDLDESLYQYLTSLHEMGYQHISLSIKDDLIGQVTLFNSDDDRPYLTDFNDKESFLKRVNRAIGRTADLTVNAVEKEELSEPRPGRCQTSKPVEPMTSAQTRMGMCKMWR